MNNKRKTNTFNRPVGGKLNQTLSLKTKIIVFVIVFIAVLIFGISYLGIEKGILFSSGLMIVILAVLLRTPHDIKAREKILNDKPLLSKKSKSKNIIHH